MKKIIIFMVLFLFIKKNIFELSLLPRLTQKLGPHFADNELNDNQIIFFLFIKKSSLHFLL